MSKEALVAAVKNAVSLSRGGKHEEAFAAYAHLYASPGLPMMILVTFRLRAYVRISSLIR